MNTQPMSPAELPRSSRRVVLKRAVQEFGNDGVTDIAAALTYYGLLSAVPGIIVLLAIVGMVGVDVHTLTAQVNHLAPGSSAQVADTLIRQAASHHSGAGLAAILGLAVAVWSASGYVAAFMRAANRVFDIGEGRPLWKKLPIRLGLTVFAMTMLVAAVVIVVVTGPIATTVGNALGVGHSAVTVWDIAKWPVLLVLVSVLLAVLFWAAPNAKQGGIRWVSPGGIAATLAWLMLSALFAVYVTNFSSYNKTYGSLAGIVVFLVWLWLTNLSLLLGLEVNAELQREQAIRQGLPEETEPFAEPRDVRKLSNEHRLEVERAREARS